MALQGKGTVFVVNIEEGSESQGLLHCMYGLLQKKLQTHPLLSVSTINSVNTFESKCVESNPKETVLLFTNEIVAKTGKLREIVKQFVNGGRLAIFGCLFSSFITPPVMNDFFKNLDLPWKSSDYNRTTFGITEIGKCLLTNVTETFSVKALQLSNVLQQQKLYTPVENATVQSMVFAPEPVNSNLAMSAFGKIGKGAVAYIGDVNAEEECDDLIVALCLAEW